MARYASAAIFIAWARVGYGWLTRARALRPIFAFIASHYGLAGENPMNIRSDQLPDAESASYFY